MWGRLIYLMGPSASGKDSLLRAVHQASGSRCRIARRFITRDPQAARHTAPEHELYIDPAHFERLKSSRTFAMHWRANGLAYGIPREIDAWMRMGNDVLVNGSRAYLPQARSQYPDLLVVLLSAPEPELRRRLQARARESHDEIEARLARNARLDALPVDCLRLENAGPLEEAVRQFLTFLEKNTVCA